MRWEINLVWDRCFLCGFPSFKKLKFSPSIGKILIQQKWIFSHNAMNPFFSTFRIRNTLPRFCFCTLKRNTLYHGILRLNFIVKTRSQTFHSKKVILVKFRWSWGNTKSNVLEVIGSIRIYISQLHPYGRLLFALYLTRNLNTDQIFHKSPKWNWWNTTSSLFFT